MTQMTKAKYKWLRLCFKNWTTSSVHSEAWKYKNDFRGFCVWFLEGTK
jgi:hypothetical protein